MQKIKNNLDLLIINQNRFNILKGYYQSGKFHPMGEKGISIKELLERLNFNNIDEFYVWYESLSQEEVKNYKKNWCPGNCCQSNLLTLLKGKIIK